ncbi:ribophorin i protein [Besnoitia besnoiti]|uniref:Dolichyl-diphosphooligosaccharide--protein glycosyltransferase subunit 1 n=1 Tax=Besnoitia besnoiti TaxID=94643 RepID=A0A2A9MBM6_BESBE|nr:ribophorin i protein [Besnoitia besnoiti]PFH34624.1 ribophorin i protein [Besnoitia besnoiti]
MERRKGLRSAPFSSSASAPLAPLSSELSSPSPSPSPSHSQSLPSSSVSGHASSLPSSSLPLLFSSSPSFSSLTSAELDPHTRANGAPRCGRSSARMSRRDSKAVTSLSSYTSISSPAASSPSLSLRASPALSSPLFHRVCARAPSAFSPACRTAGLLLLFALLLAAASPLSPAFSHASSSSASLCSSRLFVFAEASAYRFDSLEIAHRVPDLLHPLPFPVDATACSLKTLRIQGEKIRETSLKKRTQWRRGEESNEVLEAAMKSGVVIHKLERRLDMRRQVKVSVKATFANHGRETVKDLFILLPFHEAVQVGWLSATQGGKAVAVEAVSSLPRISAFSPSSPSSLSKSPLVVEEIDEALVRAAGLAPAAATPEEDADEAACGVFVLKLKLRRRLEPESKTTVDITYFLGRAYRPTPRAAPPTAVQSVLFAATAAWPAPYPAPRGSSTAVALAPNLSFGAAGAARLVKKYGFKQQSPPQGPWVVSSAEPVLPFEVGRPFILHMPLPLHLGYFLSAERYIEVSHFGNVFVHEWYRLHNDAAQPEGGYDAAAVAGLHGVQAGAPRFSRFMRREGQPEPPPPPQTHLLTHLVAALPKRAFSLEIFDQIGNVSSTRAARIGPEANPTYTELEVYPRFPLLGGWNTDFQLQYNLPARTVVSKHVDAHRYTLNVTLSPPFRDIYTEDLFLSVALPSGAHNINVTSPRAVEWEKTETLHSWLDIVTSRPLVKLYFPSTFVPDRYILQHKVQIAYDYPPFLAVEIFKQLQLCVLIFLVFLAVIFLQRMRFHIASPKEAKELETEETALSIADHLLEVFEELSQSSDDLIEATRRLASSNDSDGEKKHLSLLSEWKASLHAASRALEDNLGLLTKEAQENYFPGLRRSFQLYGHHVEGLATCLMECEGQSTRAAEVAQARADLAATELLKHIQQPEGGIKKRAEREDSARQESAEKKTN